MLRVQTNRHSTVVPKIGAQASSQASHKTQQRAVMMPTLTTSTPNIRFNVSPDVRSDSDEDGSTILHITQNKIYSIIGVGSVVWSKLADSAEGLAPADIVDQLSCDFSEIPRTQIEKDTARLLASFQRVKLIQISNSNTIRAHPQKLIRLILVFLAQHAIAGLLRIHLRVAAALVGLAIVDIFIAFGFAAVYDLVKGWPVNTRIQSRDAVDKVMQEVTRAMTWYPKQAMCLQRSAVTACLLRASGISAEMVIGCQKLPFLAHAWVEVDHQVVNDRKSVQETHKVLDRC